MEHAKLTRGGEPSRSGFLRGTAFFTLCFFLFQQIMSAGTPLQSIAALTQTEKIVQEVPISESELYTQTSSTLLSKQNSPTTAVSSVDFLQDSMPLHQSGIGEQSLDGYDTEAIADGHTKYIIHSGQPIQKAIDDASEGDIIFLGQGTYNEQLVLKKGVNLQGEDTEKTILSGDFKTQSQVIRALGNNRIEGLTITGGGIYAGSPSSAISVEGGGVTIRNNRIIDNQNNGIQVVSDGGILIEKNIFLNNDLGIQLPNDTTVIRFNTFEENRIAINVLKGKKPVIEKNIFSDSKFQSIYEFAWGEIPTRGYARVSGNTFFHNKETGSYYGSATPPAVENQGENNQFADPKFINPSAGDYHVAEDSPASHQGAFAVTDYVITLRDFTELFYEGGELVREVTPDKNEITYAPDQSMTSYRYAGGKKVIEYSRDTPPGLKLYQDGQLVETITQPFAPVIDETTIFYKLFHGEMKASYLDGVLVEILTKEGVRISNPIMDASSNVLSALLIYPDSTKEIIRDGVMLRRIHPDGTITDFLPNGLAVREITQTSTQYFIYEKLDQKTILSTTALAQDGSFASYDEFGILREVKNATQYLIYERTGNTTDGFVTSLHQPLPAPHNTQILVEGHYSKTGVVEELLLDDGTKIKFQDGKISKIYDAAGKEKTYAYQETQGMLSGLLIAAGDNRFEYDATGFQKLVEAAQREIERQISTIDPNQIELILEALGGGKLTNFKLDSSGKILEGNFETKDGLKHKIENGVETGFETADGRTYLIKDHHAILKERKLEGASVASYDEFGILSEVQNATQHLTYDRTGNATDGFVTHLHESLPAPHTTQILIEGHYSQTGVVEELLLDDGTKIKFQDGKISKIYDAAGKEKTYTYQETRRLLAGLTVTPVGNQVEYDSAGFLKSIDTAQGTINREVSSTDPNQIDLILETLGGGKLSDFKFDDSGKLLSGILETEDGIKQRIANGALVGFETLDGKIYDYKNNEAILKEWKFKDGTRVLFDGSAVSEILFLDKRRLINIQTNDQKEIKSWTEVILDEVTKEETRKIFQDGKLIEMIQPDESHLFYSAEGLLERVKPKDGPEETVSYTRDSANAITEIVFTGDKTRRVFSPTGELLRLVQSGLQAEITGGEVSKLFTRFGTMTNPVFNTQGFLTGELSLVDGSKVVIQNGELQSITRKDETLITYAAGRIDQITTAKGNYRILYDDANNATSVGNTEKNTRIEVTTPQGVKTYSLVPYLLGDAGRLDDPVVPPGLISVSPQVTSGADGFGTAGVFTTSNNNDDIWTQDLSSFQLGMGDFTIDFKVMLDATSSTGTLFAFSNQDSQNYFDLQIVPTGAGSYAWYFPFKKYLGQEGGTILFGPQIQDPGIKTGEWMHVALVRKGNTLTLYRDGKIIRDGDKSSEVSVAGISFPGTASRFTLGSFDGRFPFGGKLDEFRISDVARDFVLFPPSESYQKDANTKLLLHFDGGELSKRIESSTQTDETLKNILLPRNLVDALATDSGTSLEVTGNQTIQITPTTSDFERGTVFAIPQQLSPYWNNVDLRGTETNGGWISNWTDWDGNVVSLASLTADFVDMDGDGLKDRVFVENFDSLRAFWWVQLNTGGGFSSPQPWGEIDLTNFNNNAYSNKGLISFAGRSPYKFGDLIDMNGDGRPDRLWQRYAPTDAEAGTWYIQINNGHGFDPQKIWSKDVKKADGVFYGEYAFEIRDNNNVQKPMQEMIADLIDLDGDGLPDRVVRPYAAPYDIWYFQKNTGDGFAEVMPWTGVDTSFDTDKKIAGSLSWYEIAADPYIYDLSNLKDMNGDGRIDRILLKPHDPANVNSPFDWYVQFNNGKGFDPPILWDKDVRALPGMKSAPATSLHLFDNWNDPRNVLIDLQDVTGDGLPDRITMDQFAGSQTAHKSWWVEVNNGATFLPAVEWTGIDGVSSNETSITQDQENFRINTNVPEQNPNASNPVGNLYVSAELVDINGDKILDRVIYRQGETKWRVQFGTGKGFLPIQDLKVDAFKAKIPDATSYLYDQLQVSLKLAPSFFPMIVKGKVVVELIGKQAGDTASKVLQSWDVLNPGQTWKDLLLPVTSAATDQWESVRLRWVGENPADKATVLVDHLTFTSFRPPAIKDWLDDLLTEESVITEIHSDQTQTLANALGFRDAQNDVAFDWNTILQAETKITFDSQKEVSKIETLSGATSTVQNGNITETTLADNTRVTFDPATDKQTVTSSAGVETLNLTYSRVRTVERPDKILADKTVVHQSPLQYSYEFVNSQGQVYEGEADLSLPPGTEVTRVFDPDTGVTEKYLQDKIISRTEANGVTKEFIYNDKGEHVETQLFYKGRLQQTFFHETLSSGIRVLTLPDGSREHYDAQENLVFRQTAEGYGYGIGQSLAQKPVVSIQAEQVKDKNGTVVATIDVPTVKFEDDPDGSALKMESLQQFISEEGHTAHYDEETLKSVALKDGMNIRFDRVSEETSTDENFQSEILSKHLMDATVIHPDGTITEFKDGKPFAVVSASGRRISLLVDGPQPTVNSNSLSVDRGPSTVDNVSLVNPNLSAQFHYDQAIKLWNDVVMKSWNDFQVPSSMAVRYEYDTAGFLASRCLGDGTTERYENGKIKETFSASGERLASYTYDADGMIAKIEMESSRRNLEKSVLELQANLALERIKALEYADIQDLVLKREAEDEILSIRDQLEALLKEIEAARQDMASIKVKGKGAQGEVADGYRQIDVAASQVYAAIASLPERKKQIFEDIEKQVGDAKNQINLESKKAFFQIQDEQKRVIESIITQETFPVITAWYQKYLGRKPSTAEFERILGIDLHQPETPVVPLAQTPAPAVPPQPLGTCDVENNAVSYETFVTQCASLDKPLSPYFNPAGEFLTSKLKEELRTSDERIARAREVLAILSSVKEKLSCYAGLQTLAGKTCDAKADFLIEPEWLVKLSESDVNAILKRLGAEPKEGVLLPSFNATNDEILSWLELSGQSLHFGQSAFLALEALLSNQLPVTSGQNVDSGNGLLVTGNSRVDVATRAILVDILTGTIHALEQGDLLISAYAMQKTAEIIANEKNVSNFHLQTYEMSYESLKASYDAECASAPKPCTFNQAVLIQGNHYVATKSFQELKDQTGKVIGETVTIQDPGAGPSNAQELVTISKEEFISLWANTLTTPQSNWGFVITSHAPSPQVPGEIRNTEYRILSPREEMQVRGAFWGWITKIFEKVIEFIQKVIAKVRNLVEKVLAAVFTVMQTFFPVMSFITSIGIKISGKLGKWTGKTLGKIDPVFGKLGELWTTTNGIVSDAYQESVKTFQKSKTLQTLQAGTKLVVGVVLLFVPGGQMFGVALLAQGLGDMLKLHTKLNSDVIGMIQIGAQVVGAIAGGGFDVSTFSGAVSALKSVAPLLAREFASAGFVALGNSLGWDPRLTALGSTLVGITAGGFVDSLNAANHINAASIIAAVKNGFNAGIQSISVGGFVSAGASLGLDALGAPPILQSFVPGILGQLISNASGSTGGGGGPGKLTSQEQGQNIFQKITNTVAKFGQGIVSAGHQVISFGSKVIEGIGSVTKAGFAKAADFFSGIFDRQTQETLIQAGNGSIEKALQDNCSVLRDGIHCAYQSIEIDYVSSNGQLSYKNADTHTVFDGLSKVGDFFGGKIAYAEEIDGVVINADKDSSSPNDYNLEVKGPHSSFRIQMSENEVKSLTETRETDLVSTLGAMGQDENTLKRSELLDIRQVLERDLLTGFTSLSLISKNLGQKITFDHLGALLEQSASQLRDTTERLINNAADLGPKTNAELTAHKQSEVQKILNNPDEIFVIYMNANEFIVPTAIRRLTYDGGPNSISVNHAALVFKKDNQLYVAELGLHGLRMKKLEEFLVGAKDVFVQQLPLSISQKSELIQDELFKAYFDETTLKPKVDMQYDLVAIGEGLANRDLFSWNSRNVCSQFICSLIDGVDKSDFKYESLNGDGVVDPNELMIIIERRFKKNDNTP